MKQFYRRHRPHIQPPGATLFVTFRLFGSLPRRVIQELREEYDRLQRDLVKLKNRDPKSSTLRKLYADQKRLIVRLDNHLHETPTGPHYLKDRRIAELVCSAMKFLDQKKYDLLAFCVMSNHVHIVFTPLRKGDGEYHSLERIMHSIKSYTATKANEILNRKGRPFWAHESFDHYSRSPAETERIIAYVSNNPVKAGLVESPWQWRWSYVSDKLPACRLAPSRDACRT